jgi:hypothetical protein
MRSRTHLALGKDAWPYKHSRTTTLCVEGHYSCNALLPRASSFPRRTLWHAWRVTRVAGLWTRHDLRPYRLLDSHSRSNRGSFSESSRVGHSLHDRHGLTPDGHQRIRLSVHNSTGGRVFTARPDSSLSSRRALFRYPFSAAHRFVTAPFDESQGNLGAVEDRREGLWADLFVPWPFWSGSF